ncbi:hypothetical protein, partial [Borborobacter arsenicus]|uniref:hypothetical protein n=1 Tax=Borborobacter arsenicus TaxID=1851146 RepID=UPI001AEC8B0F
CNPDQLRLIGRSPPCPSSTQAGGPFYAKIRGPDSMVIDSVLSDEEVREVYEQALFLLESHESGEPEARPVFEAAREIIEAQLR